MRTQILFAGTQYAGKYWLTMSAAANKANAMIHNTTSNGEPELTTSAELSLWGIGASLNASRDLSFDIFVLVVEFATYYKTY